MPNRIVRALVRALVRNSSPVEQLVAAATSDGTINSVVPSLPRLH